MERMRLLLLLTLVSTVGGAAAAEGVRVDVWLTRGDQVNLLDQRPPLTFVAGGGSNGTKVDLDSGTRYQTIDGFGAAMTDSSAWLIDNKLSAAARQSLLADLFSPTDGLGLSVVRIPMGASDFALTPYTYNDLPTGQTDVNLEHFSIAYDLPYIIPALQAAASWNPNLKIIASPWSPPAWMKTSQTLFGGSFNTAFYATYAQYFVRFIQGYAAEGVDIYAVTPQNEPLHSSSGLPSMSMPTFIQSAFVGDHLGPALAAANLDTKIFVYDHNWDEWTYPVVVLNDPEAGQYAAGAAFHGYGGDVSNQSLLHDFHPDKEIHFTEISGGGWSTDFGSNLVWNFRNIIIGATRNWARSAVYWNIALDENSGPFIPGGCSNCRGVVTISNSGAITRNVEYYVLAHASKFVKPGAQRIASDSFDNVLETVAFRNPDGSEVLIALNPSGGSRWFDLVRNDASFAYRLTGRSVATFVWQPPAVPGDVNNDGFANATDGVLLTNCLSGPQSGAPTPQCTLGDPALADQDADADIDLADFAGLSLLLAE